MKKEVIFFAVALLLVAVGWFARDFLYRQPITEPQIPTEKTSEKPEGVLCAQVITPARNPQTGDIKEFPTPCDVPTGWEAIENDIPTL